MKYILLFLGLVVLPFGLSAQEMGPIADVVLRTDTSQFRFSKDRLKLQDRWVLPFAYQRKNASVEINLEVPLLDPDAELFLIQGAEYQLLDSLDFYSEQVLQFRIKTTDWSAIEQLPLFFRLVNKDGSEKKLSLYLYPYTIPKVQLRQADEELYIGEEKAFELIGTGLDQVEASNLWENQGPFDTRLRGNEDRLRLFLLPLQLGSYELKLPLRSRKWFRNVQGAYTTELPVLRQKFTIKGGRLAFLSPDKNEIIAEEGIGKSIEIQVDHGRLLALKKTYRIENQQEAGGQLIAELFTRSTLANDKVLCWLRPYGYHRLSEGYLYIKDGDEAKFISNFNLIEKAGISKVSVLHEGSDWSENLGVQPGEKFDIRLEGNGLLRSRINLEGIEDWVRDSTTATDQVVVYHARIPQNVAERKISVLLNRRNSGFELQVREFQHPRNLDFVSIDFGEGFKPITQFNKPILYGKTLQNVVLRFNPDQIESVNRLYGKQYLTVDINLYNNKKELMEYKRLENVVVCPGENSIRHSFYDNRDCQAPDISLNNQMARKTQDLPDWGRIEILVKTNPQKYGSVGFTQKLEVVQKRKYSFDIDISFPAGLIIKKVGVDGLGNLSGISTAIVAQLGFYRPDKIERYYPFKVGAGFIALNAFNFADNNDRDVGLVALGSVFPTKVNARFSFPLYLGFGYLLKDARWFYILGPGVQIRF